jgi:hypothetical protein
MTGITEAPAFKLDRSPIRERTTIDFRDYGFLIAEKAIDNFDVVPSILSADEGFLLFFPREDLRNEKWSLLNLHIFKNQPEDIEKFARSRGASVSEIALTPITAFALPGFGYDRTITIAELFRGAEQVIDFIGADPAWVVRDSHYYFRHGDDCCYTGIIHAADADPCTYDALRATLFAGVHFEILTTAKG